MFYIIKLYRYYSIISNYKNNYELLSFHPKIELDIYLLISPLYLSIDDLLFQTECIRSEPNN